MGKQAIDAPRKNYFMVDPGQLTIVGLDTDDGSEHPLYDERIKLPVSKKLAANIKVHGVLQPIKVRKDGEALQVVMGRQRVRACRVANEALTKEGSEEVLVPCIVERGQDAYMAGIMVSENEMREDDSPMAKARKTQKLLTLGRTEEECAVIFGVSTRSIKNWVELLELDDTVQKAIDQGLVKASAVASLHKLPREEQRAKLKEILEVGEQTGKRPTQRVAEKKSGTETAKTQAPTKRQVANLVKYAKDEVEELWNLGFEEDFLEAFLVGMRVVTGDLPVTSVKGLSKAFALSDERAKERKKAKPKAEKKTKAKGKSSKKKTKAKGKSSKKKASKGPRKPPKKKAKKKK